MNKYLILLLAFSYCSTLEPSSQSMTKNASSDKIWKNIGNPGFSAGESLRLSVAIDDESTPYISYRDLAYNNKVSVMKYDGTNWQYVGERGFGGSGESKLYQTSLVIYKGVPYVSYRNGGFGNSTSVMAYNEAVNEWFHIGEKGIKSGGWQSLAIDNKEVPYVAFDDWENKHKATVLKYNGTNWQYLGTSGFSTGSISFVSLKIAPNGTPYIAFQDKSKGSKASVMRYNKTTNEWEDVGLLGFSTGQVIVPSLAISPNGTPYIGFQDETQGYKATVMKMVVQP